MARRPPHALLLACLLGAALSIAFAPGIYCSDDTRYVVGIYKLANGIPLDLTTSAERRLWFLLPFAAFFHSTSGLAPLLLLALLVHVALVALTYRCARSLLPAPAAACAAFAVAVHPLLYVFAVALLPDLASSLAILASVEALLRWETAGRRPADLMRAGLFSGVSLCIKESGAPLLLLFLPFLADRGEEASPKTWLADVARRCGWFVLGLLVVLAIDTVLFRVFTGRFHSSALLASTPPDFGPYLRDQGVLPWSRFATLAALLRRFVPWSCVAPLVALAPLLGTGVPRERRRALAILVTFAVAPLLLFTFGTTSLHAYVPPVIQARYFAPVVAPGAIAVVAGLWWISPRPRIAIAASIAFVALVAVQGLASNLATRGNVYASAYKTSLAEARADLGARYPGVPIVDAPGGRADLARCRKILAEAPHLSDDLVRGRLVYDAAALAPPFIVLGPRGFMDLEHPFVARLRSGAGEGLWSPELVGSYAPAPASTAKPTDDAFALEAVLFSAPPSSAPPSSVPRSP